MLRPLLLTIALCALLPSCDKARSDAIRLTNQGMKALGDGDVRQAKMRFSDAINVDSDNARAHYGLGVSLVELGNSELAAKHLKEALRLDGSITEASYHLGALAFAEQAYDEAQARLQKVLVQDPDHSAAHDLVGRIHGHRGELKEAEVALRRSITLDPFQPASWVELARLYVRVEAEDEALAVLQEGLRHNTPERVRSTASLSLLHNELGIMLQGRGQYGLAIDELLKAVRLPGASPEVVFNLGWGYASKGDAALALKYFQQYVGLVDGHDPTARIAIEVSRHLGQRARRQREAADTP